MSALGELRAMRESPQAASRTEVLAGLLDQPKTLPPKLFYDARGAALFEAICELDEYYLTRTELAILAVAAPIAAQVVGAGVSLVEYGSGAGRKVRLLLDACARPAAYVPIDISHEQLRRVAAEVGDAYPSIAVRPLHADFAAPITLPPDLPDGPRLGFFPGSTIGNFHPADATAFLERARRTLGPGGALLLGVDRIKPVPELLAAYDDRRGITAEFNRNLLVRLNREVDAAFDPSAFAHEARWDPVARRIEMHLVSRVAQSVAVAGRVVDFTAGESIWTECSYKYDFRRLRRLALSAGFEVEICWTDPENRFYVALLRAQVD